MSRYLYFPKIVAKRILREVLRVSCRVAATTTLVCCDLYDIFDPKGKIKMYDSVEEYMRYHFLGETKNHESKRR